MGFREKNNLVSFLEIASKISTEFTHEKFERESQKSTFVSLKTHIKHIRQEKTRKTTRIEIDELNSIITYSPEFISAICHNPDKTVSVVNKAIVPGIAQ